MTKVSPVNTNKN